MNRVSWYRSAGCCHKYCTAYAIVCVSGFKRARGWPDSQCVAIWNSRTDQSSHRWKHMSEIKLLSCLMYWFQFRSVHLYLYSIRYNQNCLQVPDRDPECGPQTSNGAVKNCLLTGKNLDQDQASLGREPPADGQMGKRGGAADVNIKGSLSQEQLICFISFFFSFC